MITAQLLETVTKGRANNKFVGALAKHLTDLMPTYGLTTPLRQAHFLAQAAHESDGFKTLVEYASGDAYEGRKDLGNTVKGDGRRFKGRGIFQLTGRSNYKAFGKRLGVDLVSHPEAAAEPYNAVRIALEYWKSRKLNALADKNDIQAITLRINGGYNGLAARKRYFSAFQKALGKPLVPFLPVADLEPPLAREDSVAAPNAAGEDVSDSDPVITPESGEFLIKALQTELKAKHYYNAGNLIDGKWTDGSLTDDAVVLLQKRNGLEVGSNAIRISEVRAAQPYVVTTREDATVETLKERADPVTTFTGRVKAGVKWVLGLFGLGGAAAGVDHAGDGGASNVLDTAEKTLTLWERVQLVLAPFADLFWTVLPWILVPVAIGVPAAWILSKYVERKRLAAFKAGLT